MLKIGTLVNQTVWLVIYLNTPMKMKLKLFFSQLILRKHFDSIEHPFLFAVLKSFGFGADFIQWIRTFFNNPKSCVMNNGNSIRYFFLKRGTRQEDPLSAYLFILVLEILLIRIRNNKDINRVMIYNIEIKLSAYADDSSFFVVNTKSLHLIFNICESFEEFSSLKLQMTCFFYC